MNEEHTTIAELLIGKHVLVGITRLDHSGQLISQEQFHGHVTAIDTSVHIRLSTGLDYALPPDAASFLPAQPGEYRLRATGEVVVDPDFTTSWTITAPPPEWKPADETNPE